MDPQQTNQGRSYVFYFIFFPFYPTQNHIFYHLLS